MIHSGALVVEGYLKERTEMDDPLPGVQIEVSSHDQEKVLVLPPMPDVLPTGEGGKVSREHLKATIQDLIRAKQDAKIKSMLGRVKPPRYDKVFFEGVKWLDTL